MTPGRIMKTEEQLEDDSIIAYIRGFVTVQAADWRRRQLNAVLPRVMQAVDEARAAGHAIDTEALVKQVWLNHRLPTLDES